MSDYSKSIRFVKRPKGAPKGSPIKIPSMMNLENRSIALHTAGLKHELKNKEKGRDNLLDVRSKSVLTIWPTNTVGQEETRTKV